MRALVGAPAAEGTGLRPMPAIRAHDRTTDRPRTLLERATFWALCTFVFTVPWQNTLILPVLGTVSRSVGLLVAVLAGASVLRHGRRYRLLDTHLFVAAYTAWVAVSYFWSGAPSGAEARVQTMLQLLVMVLAIWEFARARGQYVALLWAFVAGCYVSAVNTFVTFLSESEERFRFAAEGFNANGLGLILTLGVPIAWYAASTTAGRWATLGRVYPILAIPAILLTASRGALLTLVPAVLIIPLMPARASSRLRSIALGSLALVFVLEASLIPQETLNRLETIPAELQEGDLSSRAPLWEAALAILEARPFTGTGAGGSNSVIESETGREAGAHNSYLSIAAESGGIGLALFAMIVASTVVRSARLPTRERVFALVLLVTLLFGIIPLRYEYQKTTWLVLALVVSIYGLRARDDVPPVQLPARTSAP